MTIQFVPPAPKSTSSTEWQEASDQATRTRGDLRGWEKFNGRTGLWSQFFGEQESVSPEISIVIPTFNEIANIAEVIRRISRALAEVSWEVIVVDDDSPDGTAALVKKIARRDPRIRCLRRVNQRGLAGACIAGMLSSAAPYVAVMDADLQHDESTLVKMLAILRKGEVDLVIGSRHVIGGCMGTGLSDLRALVSRCSTQVARVILKTEVQDLMSGFFAIRRDRFDVIAPHLTTSGFKILADIIASSPMLLQISEVGYTFRERGVGYSKLDVKVALDFAAFLVNKLTRELIPIRFVLFALVGAIGVIIHLSVLRSAMLTLPQMEFSGAQALAAFVAMTSNFFVNNRITYREQKIKGTTAILRGLILFYAVCALGAVANVGIGSWVFDRTYIWWLGGLSGLIIGSVWNYTLSSLFVWSWRH
jgi:dolichol-phosphate mannosyltransferase